jgi:D-apionolactonase
MSLDPTTGFLRGVFLGEQEVLRGVYAAVRDRNWGTVPGALRERHREVDRDRFVIEFVCEHRQGEIDFVWEGRLTGEADGTVRYEFKGEARSTFWRNRIGFCVLHPIRECAGVSARQVRVGGEVLEGEFPVRIEPQIFGRSSFRDLRKVSHPVGDGIWAEVEFAGEVFEMEDQRNWTDASYKTYGTPLALPFPVEVKAGTRVEQAVTLRLTGPGVVHGVEAATPLVVQSDTRGGSDGPVELRIPTGGWARLPSIGLGIASHGRALRTGEVAWLRRLPLAHLRVDLRLGEEGWRGLLDQAVRESSELGVGVELAVHLPRAGEAGLAGLAERMQRLAGPWARVLALRDGESATRPETVRSVREVMGRFGVPCGVGSDCNFCELNRDQALGRVRVDDADFLFWSINPQVHATDGQSVMETLEVLRDTVLTARDFARGRPLVVTPVTLKQRFNPVATGSEARPLPGELPAQVDVRQMCLFGAAWTLGCVRALAMAGVESVTLFETTGWRGVMESDSGSLLPERFPSAPGMPFPLFQLLLGLRGFDRFGVIEASRPGRAMGLWLGDESGRRRILVGNLTSGRVVLKLEGMDGVWGVRRLDLGAVRGWVAGAGEMWGWAPEPKPGRELGELGLELSGYEVVGMDPMVEG